MTASSAASTSVGSTAWPSRTSLRSPNRFVPCGVSSWSTNRPFAYARAFSSSSDGTGSAAILRSSPTIVDTASSIRLMSTPACETSVPVSVWA